MRFVRYQTTQEAWYGIVEGDSVRPLSHSPFDSLQPIQRSLPLAEVKLLAPCLPSKIFALAFNYQDHLSGKEPPREPQVFLKVPSSVIGPGDPIILPQGQGRVDEEGELVVVVGRRCRNVRREEAMNYVFGYTCGNDVSAREWQKNDLNWWRAKSSDTFSPLGPAIVTGLDPSGLEIFVRINGKKVQNCTTKDLIFDVPRLIEWISRSVTLEPGDLIFTGTSGIPAELHAGDTVEVEIEGIGTLENPVRE